MQLGFELRPVNVLAAENPLVEHVFFQCIFDELGDELEMVEGIVGDAALGVASIVASEAVAAAAAGQGMEEIHALTEFAEAQIEQARAMTIEEDDAEAGKCPEQLGEGLQVEMAIH